MNSYAVNLQPRQPLEEPCFAEEMTPADYDELRSSNWRPAFDRMLQQCEVIEDVRWLVDVTFGDRGETIGFTVDAMLFWSDDLVPRTLRVLVTEPTYYLGELHSPTLISVEIM